MGSDFRRGWNGDQPRSIGADDHHMRTLADLLDVSFAVPAKEVLGRVREAHAPYLSRSAV